MADGPNDFRDPKVTNDSNSSGGIGKLIGYAIAALLALLLLLWLFGAFDNEDAVVVTDDQPVVTDQEPIVTDEQPDAVVVPVE